MQIHEYEEGGGDTTRFILTSNNGPFARDHHNCTHHKSRTKQLMSV